MVECIYLQKCKSFNNEDICKMCKNNKKRNYQEDYFEKANDNMIPDECPVLDYAGPAECTNGYKCPVCGGFTNPYALHGGLCSHCGYKLRTR